jgi:hypothetical protein
MKVKYYNSTMKIGFNNWREVYDCNNEIWLKPSVHKGRLVYGRNRIPYTKIKKGIDKSNYNIEIYCPF